MSDVRERERLLAATLAHAAMQDAHYSQIPVDPTASQGWKWALSGVLILAALWIGFAPPAWLGGPEPAVPSEGDLVHGARAALYLQAQQVDAFRLRTGTLPASLDAVPRVRGVRYVRSSERAYQLRARRPDGRVVIYDSARPDAGFETVAAGWFLPRDEP